MDPSPASEVVLRGFIAPFADAGLKYHSLFVEDSVFPHEAGLDDPFRGEMPRLDYILRGVKKNEATTGSASRECLPITPVILRKMKGVWLSSGDSKDTKLIWAACFLCTSLDSYVPAS